MYAHKDLKLGKIGVGVYLTKKSLSARLVC